MHPPTAHHSPLPTSRSAFTLVELLSVIVIISLLLSAFGMAFSKARELARRARAETELREMLAAWQQYHQLYQELPKVVNDKEKLTVGRKVLAPLTGPQKPTDKWSDNPRQLVLLNPKLPFNAKDEYTDPWGTPYQLSFGHADDERVTAMRTSIVFPGRQRRFP